MYLLTGKDWFYVNQGGKPTRHLEQTFRKCGPTNRPVTSAGIFISEILTGNGSAQSTAHGLGAAPDRVIAVPMGAFKDVTGAIAMGTHTDTAVVVTVPNGLKYQILAILT